MDNDVAVSCRSFGGCTIVTVPGDVDAARVREIRESAAGTKGGHVVLDLAAASHMPTSAATALAALHHRVRSEGGGMCIVTREPDVRSRVRRAAHGSVPRFYDEIGDALEASMVARQAAHRPRLRAGVAG